MRKLSVGGAFEEGGWPDVLVLAVNSVLSFVEFKREGESLDARQKFRSEALLNRGFYAYKVESLEGAVLVADAIRKRLGDARAALGPRASENRRRVETLISTLDATRDLVP